MNKQGYQFNLEIKKVAGIDGAYVEIPLDIRQVFGKGRLKVTATFDRVKYDGSIVNMGVKTKAGGICYIIGIRQDIRAQINKQPGDYVQVTFKERL